MPKQPKSSKPQEPDAPVGPTEVPRRSDEQPHYQQQRPLAQPPGFHWDTK